MRFYHSPLTIIFHREQSVKFWVERNACHIIEAVQVYRFNRAKNLFIF